MLGHVVAAGNPESRCAALKQLLLRKDSLSAVERADRLLSLSCFPGTAVALMDTMLSQLGSDKGRVIFLHIFQRQLQPPVCAVLANSL